MPQLFPGVALIRALRCLMPRLFIPFLILVHSLRGEETGSDVADSTKPWHGGDGPPRDGSTASSSTW